MITATKALARDNGCGGGGGVMGVCVSRLEIVEQD